MKVHKATFILILLFGLKIYSQNETALVSNPDLIKHQVGIGISKFINSAFSSDVNSYDMEYRYKYSERISLRAGASYEKDNSDNGFVDGGIKLGVDRTFRKYTNWTIYYGADLIGNYSNFTNINKDIYSFGFAPLLGIQYNVSKNFSVSIEPMFFVKYNIVVDNSTFQKDNITKWTESGFGKLGYIQVNFHF
jgi:hypothetical protein